MNVDESRTLLQRIACRDNRKPSAAMLATWSTAMADVDLPDAIEAVNRLDRETTEFLMPKHVLDKVKAIRHDRAHRDRLHRQIELIDSIETTAEKSRSARRRAIRNCTRCNEVGRLPNGRFCPHQRPDGPS